MKNGSQTIFMVIGALVVVGALGYFIFGTSEKEPEGLVSQATGGAATPLVTNLQSDSAVARDELLMLLQSVSRVSLDTSLLDSQSFQRLKDIGILLPPVSSQGRSNPFAPYTGTIMQINPAPTGGTTIQGSSDDEFLLDESDGFNGLF
jgi:hypothetical protein